MSDNAMAEAIRGAVAGSVGTNPDFVGVVVGENAVIVLLPPGCEWAEAGTVGTIRSMGFYGPVLVQYTRMT